MATKHVLDTPNTTDRDDEEPLNGVEWPKDEDLEPEEPHDTEPEEDDGTDAEQEYYRDGIEREFDWLDDDDDEDDDIDFGPEGGAMVCV